MKKNIILLFALLCQVLGVAAEDKVYINDFSIKAGETKRIELCFDTETTGYTRLEGTVTMPAGLTVQNQGTTESFVWMTGNAARTGGAMVSYNPTTGGVMMTSGQFTAGTGAVGYIDVTASTDLAETSTITITNFRAKKSNAPYVDVTSENCTVTRDSGEGGSGGEGGEQSSELTFAFSPASLTMTKGETATVEVTMANGMNLTGMQATLTASDGLTITSVARGNRISGQFNYNDGTGKVVSLGGISGNEGTVFTVTLQADDDFSGSTTLTVGGLTVTTASAQSISATDISLPVNVIGPTTVTLSLEKVALAAGGTASVDVLISTDIALTGVQATLTLPENITAVMSNKISDFYLSYNPATGKIIYMGGLAGESIPAADETRLCTLTLTADDSFAASGELTLTGITVSTSAAQSIGVPDMTLPVELAVTLNEEDENDDVLEALDGQTCTVTLQRTLAAGSWNTFAVPFAVGAETLSALGFSAVKALESTTFEGETLTLNFTDAESVEAGKPYLVKVAADVTNPVFDGAVVSKEPTPTVTTYADFIPTLGKTTIEGVAADDVLFVAAGNKLKNPGTIPTDMKGFRAYFQLKGAGAGARSFSLNLGDEATGISEIENGKLKIENGVYDLQGRRMESSMFNVQSSMLKKGVYIVDGKKVIIK